MERKGIIAAGNWIVDSVKFIDVYPTKGNLVSIRREEEGLGGCAHNVLVDLARLESGIPLYAGGCIGNDKKGRMALEACGRYGIDASNIRIMDDAPTSYTDVMSEIGGSATRTFFHCRGANALLSPEMIEAIDVPALIFHLGYLLLLDKLDSADAEYGVVAARVLDNLQKKGFRTSVDVVSEEGDRYRSVILPCLKYVDYFIVNEVEAGACLDTNLRDSSGCVDVEKVKQTAVRLLKMGVGRIAAIHFPEGGVAASNTGEICFVQSELMPSSEIVSTVGAGDAFCAGALYAIHEGYSLEAMLKFAAACARFNLRSADSTSGAPSLSELSKHCN